MILCSFLILEIIKFKNSPDKISQKRLKSHFKRFWLNRDKLFTFDSGEIGENGADKFSIYLFQQSWKWWTKTTKLIWSKWSQQRCPGTFSWPLRVFVSTEVRVKRTIEPSTNSFLKKKSEVFKDKSCHVMSMWTWNVNGIR